MNAEKGSKKKKLILASVCAALATVSAGFVIAGYASGSRPKGPSELTLHPELQEQILAERRAKEIQEKLSLTEEQTVKVRDEVMALRNDLHALRRENKGNGEAFRPMARARLGKFTGNLRALLTEEQRVQFDAIKSDRMERLDALREMMGR